MSDQTITVASADIVDAAYPPSVASREAMAIRGARRVYEGASVPAQQLDTEVVTVKATGRSAYAYCARAARRVLRSITVKARQFAAAVESRVRAFLENVFPKTGVDILRQSAILLS